MTDKQTDTSGGANKGRKGDAGRDDRLKSALKANLARRKAQARARNSAQKDTENQPKTGVQSGAEPSKSDVNKG